MSSTSDLQFVLNWVSWVLSSFWTELILAVLWLSLVGLFIHFRR